MYHTTPIKKEQPGTLEKLREEVEEAIDAAKQGSRIMVGVELADCQLALNQAARAWGLARTDLETFAAITSRAYVATRGGLHVKEHVQMPDFARCRDLAGWLDVANLEWVTFGTGFVVAQIHEDLKVHIWDKEFAALGWGAIHSHRWDLQSTVLTGWVSGEIYRATPGNGQKLTTCCTRESRECSIELAGQTRVSAGETYLEGRGTLHKVTGAAPGTVTVVRKLRRRGKAHFVDEGLPNPYESANQLTTEQRAVVSEAMWKVTNQWL